MNCAHELLSRRVALSHPPSSLQEIMAIIHLLALLYALSFGHSSASRSAEERHRPSRITARCSIWEAEISCPPAALLGKAKMTFILFHRAAKNDHFCRSLIHLTFFQLTDEGLRWTSQTPQPCVFIRKLMESFELVSSFKFLNVQRD